MLHRCRVASKVQSPDIICLDVYDNSYVVLSNVVDVPSDMYAPISGNYVISGGRILKRTTAKWNATSSEDANNGGIIETF